jgi:hypothetical protein
MKTIRIPLNLTNLDGTIIDVETTHFDATKGELLTAGFLAKNGITIIQRMNSTEVDFRKIVNNGIGDFMKPLYAFNKDMEERFLPVKIDNDLQSQQEAAFGALLNEGLLDHYGLLSDPCFNDDIPQFWEAWLITKNPIFVSKIVRHNCCCLAKEYYIKQKRMDRLETNKIQKLPSSAQLEMRFIRPQLGISKKVE